MSTNTPLNIQISTDLQQRLAIQPNFSAAFSNLNITELAKSNALWVIYAPNISQALIQQIEAQSNQQAVLAWQVGRYDVVLMSGELSASIKELVHANHADCADIRAVPDLDIPDIGKAGLIVMDMDSTAIQIECIDEIAKLAGVGEQVSAVTERAMQGELDFEESLRERVGALKGADEAILEQVKATLPIMPELEELIATLKQFGWKTAIASGGFTYFSDHLKQTLALDHAYANQLEIVDGKLTGEVLGEVVSAQTKADVLVALANQYGIEKKNTLAIGDGANDLVMMSAAGLGIAYHAKPKVDAQAQVAIRHADLAGVICVLSAKMILSAR